MTDFQMSAGTGEQRAPVARVGSESGPSQPTAGSGLGDNVPEPSHLTDEGGSSFQRRATSTTRLSSAPPAPSAASPSLRYGTIVADPPWSYAEGWPVNRGANAGSRIGLPYSSMTVEAIASLRVPAAADAHLFLWTTHRYLDDAFDVVRSWGFRPSSTLTWCKDPVGIGPGGMFAVTSEFVIYARKGKPKHKRRVETTWWNWPRGAHSAKPEAFLDLVESVVDGPYLELFARRQRLGWDTWGDEALNHVEMSA